MHRLTLPLAALALTPFVLAQDGMSPDAPPPMPPVEDAPEPGPAPYEADEAYETISTELSLQDQGRDKMIDIRFTVPIIPEGEQQTEPFPVIIFSHGLGGSNRAFPRAAELWASAGYVVLRITHADSGSLRGLRETREDRGPLREPHAWIERAEDQKRLANALDRVFGAVPIANGLQIDIGTVATVGHSFGSQTAQMMAGAILQGEDGEPIDLGDDIFDAAIPISVQVPGQMGFTEESYAGMDIPVLMITGTKDAGQNGTTGLDRTKVFDMYPAGDKHMLFIAGAAHSSFQDRREMRPSARVLTRTGNTAEQDAAYALHTRTVALAFLDAYLKQDPEAIEYINSMAPSAVGESRAVWISR